LLRYPWRTLTALGNVYRVSAHHHLDKKDVARELDAAIHAQLSHTLVTLGSDALAALRALLQAENLAMPRTDFITRFGCLHPYRPWDPDAPLAPWPDPLSPAATLAYYGLVYPLNQGSTERPFSVILLPEDLCHAIVEHLDITVTLSTPPLEPPTAPARAVDANMFAFLSFLNRRDYLARHGRWLPPRALKCSISTLLHPMTWAQAAVSSNPPASRSSTTWPSGPD